MKRIFNPISMKKDVSFFIRLTILITMPFVRQVSAQTITSFSPSSGPIGTTVTIIGTNFSATSANNIIYFGATRATVTSATSTQLTVTVPAGATYQPISVLVNGLTAYSRAPFVVTFPGGGTIDATSLAAKVDLPTPSNPGSVAVGDLDGDGKPDLAYANGSNIISVLRNISTVGAIMTNSFTDKVNFVTGPNPYHVAIGDLDGDGKPELAVANSGSISILKNTSVTGEITASSFAPGVEFPTGAGSLTIGDLNGDGKPDLIGIDNNGDISVLQNISSTGTITGSSFAPKVNFQTGVGGNPRDLAIGDLDGDGKPELVAVYGELSVNNFYHGYSPYWILTSYVSVFKNTSTTGPIMTSSFAPRIDFIPSPSEIGLSQLLPQYDFGVAIGDLDGDGKQDLAITNKAVDAITLVIISTNSFTPEFHSTIGRPFRVAIGDLDGDGKADLAATDYNSSVSLFKNTTMAGVITSSSFADGVNFTTDNQPKSVAIGDLDGDGTPETITANMGSSISIFQNLISKPKIKSFSPRFGATGATVTINGFNFDPTPANNAVAFNGTVAAVASSTSTHITTSVPLGATTGALTVMVSGISATGSANFTVTNIASFFPTSGTFGTTVTITGFDFDPIPANNFVAFNGTLTSVTVSTATSITTTVPFGSTTGVITVTVNGLTSVSPTNFTVITPLPTITSFTPTYGTIGTTVTIVGTNFNPTPANNIVFFGATRASVTAANTTQLTVTVPAGVTYQPISVLVYGLTAYSSAPYVVTFPDGGAIETNSFAPKVDFATGNYPYCVAIGDLDGDGKPDLATAIEGDNILSVFKNGSTTGIITANSFAPKVDFTTGLNTNPQSVAIGDLDGDGKPDLATANSNSTVSILKNTGITGEIAPISFVAKVDFNTGMVSRSVAIGDLDGDGRPDLAVANAHSLSNTVSVFKNMTATGTITANSFAVKVDIATGENPSSVAVGDLDGDGKPDLAVANDGSNTVSVFRNTGVAGAITVSSFAPKVDFATGSNPTYVAIGDLDSDGKPDLAVTNSNNNTISVFRNASTIGVLSFAAKVDFTTGSHPHSVAIGDLDGDGKVDLAVENNGASTVSVFKNTSTTGAITANSFATKIDFATGGSTWSIAIGDLDGDGKPDLAVTGFNNTVSILRNTVRPFQTITFAGIPMKTTGDPPFDLSASSSSGLPILFSTMSDKINLAGSRVTLVKPGSVSISADQPGNSNFSRAATVVQTFCVKPAKPSISVNETNLGPVLTASTGDSYQWFRDGVPTATGESLTPRAGGAYTVTIKVDGCESDSSDPQVIIITGDISKNRLEVSVYPVPAHEQLFVKGASLNSGNCSVINILGKESQPPFQLIRDGALVDIRELSSGIYFLKAYDGTKIVHIKFIKE